MLYRPLSLVIVLRTPSINTGLETSTETPGRTAPDESLTNPAIELCPNAAGAAKITNAKKRSTDTPLDGFLRFIDFPPQCWKGAYDGGSDASRKARNVLYAYRKIRHGLHGFRG